MFAGSICRSSCSVPFLVLALSIGMLRTAANAAPLEQPASLSPVDGGATREAPGEDLAEETSEVDDILNMDLDQLAEADVHRGLADSTLSEVVSTVSRSETPIAKTPSAVYVVTQEMIRRSGARNVMEVLRTVPGVHVARLSASSWAISMRGFNSAFADKLLVQIDGRAIYTPVFSGVHWEQQLVPLYDIERIEVIRGPGATVWGSNAVNGVINIVTKDSADTVGLYAEAGGGNEHQSFGGGRVGGVLGQNATYRVYGTALEDDAGLAPPAGEEFARRGAQGGFRMDWSPDSCDTVTFQGDFGAGGSSIGSSTQTDYTNGNFLARWTHKIDSDTEWSVQSYYDHFKQTLEPTAPTLNYLGLNTFDIDAQLNATRGCHDLVCGFGYRTYESYTNTLPGQFVNFVPPEDTFDIISYFVQDTVTLRDELLYLTLGCKFEHYDFVGFVYQPAVKLAATPDERTSVWASVSRSARIPSVGNRDVTYISPIGGGQFLNKLTSRSIQEEQAMTYEIGLRRQPTADFYWEIAAYFSRYDDLIRGSVTSVTAPFLNVDYLNTGSADNYGFEAWAAYEINEHMRLRGWYSFYREDFDDAPLPAVDLVNVAGTYPRNQAYLGLSTDLTRCVTCDVGLRYVDRLRIGEQAILVPSYLTMDVRLAWRLGNGFEAAVVGQNLLDRDQIEFSEPTGLSGATGVERSVYGMLTWEY